MAAHPITASQAAQTLREIANGTRDPRAAYAYPAEAAATIDAIRECADLLTEITLNLHSYVRAHLHTETWRSTDRNPPRTWTENAVNGTNNARHHSRQLSVHLDLAANALRNLAPK
ncbi:hypothetical protein OG730_41920 (plasmid) [Streptomyces sp. NBC_01298]|uniref:hypothetical protein n=1 Tax=Streptomyces sp. NBC_01298 TaxID=2903817 RepID=UPI002E0F9AD9|nr:hypothetical protein OG730_41920 [Streptomyces sp. NBC_01298]